MGNWLRHRAEKDGGLRSGKMKGAGHVTGRTVTHPARQQAVVPATGSSAP